MVFFYVLYLARNMYGFFAVENNKVYGREKRSGENVRKLYDSRARLGYFQFCPLA